MTQAVASQKYIASHTWSVAAILFVLGDLASSFFLYFVEAMFVMFLNLNIHSLSILTLFTSFLVPPLVAWVGVMNSVPFLKKRCLITNPRTVVILATSFYVLFWAFLMGSAWYNAIRNSIPLDNSFRMGIAAAGDLLGVATFYFTSRKLLK